MIECSFCLSSKSQRYLYTVCQHFVCVDCASLRAKQMLECCQKTTILAQQAKLQLKAIKQITLKNMQDGYNYQKTNRNTMSLEEIQRKLHKINDLDQGAESSFMRRNFNKQFENTLRQKTIDKIPKKRQSNKIKADEQASPIKLVESTQEEENCSNEQSIYNIMPTTLKKPQKFINKSEISKRNDTMQLIKQEFGLILSSKITEIKDKFRQLYKFISEMEIETIYGIKVHYQEYVKLVQKQYSAMNLDCSVLDVEKDRLRKYLNQFVHKSHIQKLRQNIEKNSWKNDQSKNDEIKFKTQFSEKQAKKLQQHLNHLFQSSRQSISNMQQISKQCLQFQGLDSNKVGDKPESQNGGQTKRNLDRIYKKLEESRTKLFQRIQLHNQFINRRCTKLSNI